MDAVIRLLDRGDFETQREAAWAVTNLTISGNPLQIKHLVDHDAIRALCSLLSVNDTQILQVVLDGLFQILKKLYSQTDLICQKIEECGGLDKIEQLQVIIS